MKSSIDDAFERQLSPKYNIWGERKPLVCNDKEKLQQALLLSASQKSPLIKSALYLNKVTNCKGLEFVAFSNAKINQPIILPNDIYLYPCFVFNENYRDPMACLNTTTTRMLNNSRFVYDGWLPIESNEPTTILSRINMLNQSVSISALIAGSKFEWKPKYEVFDNGTPTHFYTEEQIGTLQDLAVGFKKFNDKDRTAILNSIGWLAQGIGLNETKSKFLFYILAIESLCDYIESEADVSSLFHELRSDRMSKSSRKTTRNNCIHKILDKHLKDNPTKAITECYFNCIGSIKQRLKNHLILIFGEITDDIALFIEGVDGKPSLYELRHSIAHGSLNILNDKDSLIIKDNLYALETFSIKYLWKVIHKSIDVYNRSSSMTARLNIGLHNCVVPKPSMYKGAIRMDEIYTT